MRCFLNGNKAWRPPAAAVSSVAAYQSHLLFRPHVMSKRTMATKSAAKRKRNLRPREPAEEQLQELQTFIDSCRKEVESTLSPTHTVGPAFMDNMQAIMSFLNRVVQRQNLSLRIDTWNSILNVLAAIPNPDLMEDILLRIRDQPIKIQYTEATFLPFIVAFARLGEISKLITLFTHIELAFRPSYTAFSTVINALVSQPDSHTTAVFAMYVFDRMCANELQPSPHLHSQLLQCLFRAGYEPVIT